MRKFLLPLLLIIGMCMIPNRAFALTVVDLISNGDFSAGLTDWNVFSFNGGVVNESVDASGQTLNILATDATDGNATGAVQFLNVDLSNYVSLMLQLNANPVSHSLDAPGFSGVDFPLRADIGYIDTDGFNQVFRHCFYNQGTDSGACLGTLLAPNFNPDSSTWHLYTSLDLLQLLAKPKFLSSIVILGAGFDYESHADNVKLLGTLVPEPVSSVLFGFGFVTAALLKKKQ